MTNRGCPIIISTDEDEGEVFVNFRTTVADSEGVELCHGAGRIPYSKERVILKIGRDFWRQLGPETRDSIITTIMSYFG